MFDDDCEISESLDVLPNSRFARFFVPRVPIFSILTCWELEVKDTTDEFISQKCGKKTLESPNSKFGWRICKDFKLRKLKPFGWIKIMEN